MKNCRVCTAFHWGHHRNTVSVEAVGQQTVEETHHKNNEVRIGQSELLKINQSQTRPSEMKAWKFFIIIALHPDKHPHPFLRYQDKTLKEKWFINFFLYFTLNVPE